MTCSPARLLANQRNALLSTGPRTEAGKGRSRANALKHGMSGEGIALPNEDAAEVARRFAALDAEMASGCEMARILVQRVALMSVRMERAARHEAAALGEKVRHAEEAFDDRVAREVEVLADGLAREPEANARRLRATVGGIDWMLARWDDLRHVLLDPIRDMWGPDHATLADKLMGRRDGSVRASRVQALTGAIRGDFSDLDEADGGDLDDDDRSEWAREAMATLIDAEVEGLERARAAIDVEAMARDREGAADRAMFDDSPKAILARRYEAAAERGMYRALKALKEHASAAIEAEVVAGPEEVAPLGSSRPEPASVPEVRPERRPAPVAASPSPAPDPLGSIGDPDAWWRGRGNALPTDAFDVVVGRPASAQSPGRSPALAGASA